MHKNFLLSMWLTLSWRRFLSYRNQSIYLLSKSVYWFLYDRDLRHDRVEQLSRYNDTWYIYVHNYTIRKSWQYFLADSTTVRWGNHVSYFFIFIMKFRLCILLQNFTILQQISRLVWVCILNLKRVNKKDKIHEWWTINCRRSTSIAYTM